MFIIPIPIWIVPWGIRFVRSLFRKALRPVLRPSPGAIPWARAVPEDYACKTMSRLLFEHANEFRQCHGLLALTGNSKLELSSWNWAEVMHQTGIFAHNINGHPELGERVGRCGYRYRCVRENLAYIQCPRQTIEQLATEVHGGWVNSPGHRENLLSSDVSELGVATVLDSSGTYWCVQNFGHPRSNERQLRHPPSQQAPLPRSDASHNTNPPKTFEEILKQYSRPSIPTSRPPRSRR